MVLPGVPIGEAFARLWLVERATLERPDRSAPGGFAVEATDVPCRVSQDRGGPVVTAGAAPTIQAPIIWFGREVALAIDWRITVTTQGNRRLKIDSIAVPAEAPLQQIRASGVR